MFKTTIVWHTPDEKLPEPQCNPNSGQIGTLLEFVLTAILSEAKDDYVLAETAIEFGETGTIVDWRFMTGPAVKQEEVLAWAYWPTYIPKLDQILEEGSYAQEEKSQ